jgi:hypothetical protein
MAVTAKHVRGRWCNYTTPALDLLPLWSRLSPEGQLIAYLWAAHQAEVRARRGER